MLPRDHIWDINSFRKLRTLFITSDFSQTNVRIPITGIVFTVNNSRSSISQSPRARWEFGSLVRASHIRRYLRLGGRALLIDQSSNILSEKRFCIISKQTNCSKEKVKFSEDKFLIEMYLRRSLFCRQLRICNKIPLIL